MRKLKAAVPTMQIVFFDTYDAAFAALADGRVDAFLADKMLVLWFAQKSGHAADFTLIGDYQLPRTSGFALKKDEPRFLDFVDRTLLDLEASGEAEENIRRVVRAAAAHLPHPARLSGLRMAAAHQRLRDEMGRPRHPAAGGPGAGDRPRPVHSRSCRPRTGCALSAAPSPRAASSQSPRRAARGFSARPICKACGRSGRCCTNSIIGRSSSRCSLRTWCALSASQSPPWSQPRPPRRKTSPSA